MKIKSTPLRPLGASPRGGEENVDGILLAARDRMKTGNIKNPY